MNLVGVFKDQDVFLHNGELYFGVDYSKTSPINRQRTDFKMIEGKFVTKLTDKEVKDFFNLRTEFRISGLRG